MQVLEETGFNVSKLINKDEYIEMTFGPQRVRLYIVGGVKDDTMFAPQTKKEISVSHLKCKRVYMLKNTSLFTKLLQRDGLKKNDLNCQLNLSL